MYISGNKIRRRKVRNKTAKYRARLKRKNHKRVARMLKD